MSKVWKLKPNSVSSLPLKTAGPYIPVNGELYSLFKKTGPRSYTRVSTMSYPAKVACFVFRSHLTADINNSIRPIKIDKTYEAQ